MRPWLVALLIAVAVPLVPGASACHHEKEFEFEVSQADGYEGDTLHLDIVRKGNVGTNWDCSSSKVNWATREVAGNLKATADEDFVQAGGQVDFGTDEGRKTINITLLADELDENLEKFEVALVHADEDALGSPKVVTVNLYDSLGGFRFGASGLTVNEADQTHTIQVDRIDGNDPAEVRVTWGGSGALAGTDYVAGETTLSFAGSTSQRSFQISLLDDDLVDGTKEVVAELTSLTTGAYIGIPGTFTLTILDNESPSNGTVDPPSANVTVAFSAATLQVNEAGPSALIDIVRAGPAGAFEVTYEVRAGTATAADFLGTSAPVPFDTDQATAPLAIPIIQDDDEEDDETFTIVLVNATGLVQIGSPSTVTITILDDDTVPEEQVPGPGMAVTLGVVAAAAFAVRRSGRRL